MADANTSAPTSAPAASVADKIHSGFFLPLALYILEGIAVGFIVFAIASMLGAIAAGAPNSWITAAEAITMSQGIGILAFAGVALWQFRNFLKL